MYAAGKPHQLKDPCVRILDDVEKKKICAVVDTEILQELLYRYSHIGLPEKGIELSREVLRYPIEVLPISESAMRLAVDLFDNFHKRGIKPRDAIHAAVIQENEITRILSADKHFDVFDFVERITPGN
jgi:predicted nucleic acid-binding protein